MRVFCLFGDDRVSMSKSPLMHNRAFKGRGMDACYVSFSVKAGLMEAALAGFRAMSFAGANVTIPHKQNVIPYLDRLSPVAQRLSAVNTIAKVDGALVGDNTDVGGFCDAVTSIGHSFRNKACLVIGTGGAARGVLMALQMLGASSVHVAGRNYEKAVELSNDLGFESLEIGKLCSHSVNFSLVVNATSVSSPREADDEMTIIANSLIINDLELIFDINYGRSENIWKNAANSIGCDFSDGLIMLAAQAARSFNIWTNESATLEEFLSYLE